MINLDKDNQENLDDKESNGSFSKFEFNLNFDFDFIALCLLAGFVIWLKHT